VLEIKEIYTAVVIPSWTDELLKERRL